MSKITKQKIKTIRKELGLTQAQFGKLLGFGNSSYICRIETGSLKVSKRVSDKIKELCPDKGTNLEPKVMMINNHRSLAELKRENYLLKAEMLKIKLASGIAFDVESI